jgi:hypothetical protein
MQSEEKVKATINGEWLAEQVAGIIYNQGKAKIMNLLESQIPESEPLRLSACKGIVQDALEVIIYNTTRLIKDTLGDWQQEVEFGGELTLEEELKALKEHNELKKVYK